MGCTDGYFTLAAVGSQVFGPYTGRPGNCSPLTPPNTTTWSVGADVPMTNFPEVTTALVGTGRIRAQVAVSDDVPLAQTGAFDTSVNAACTPTSIGGGWYCTTSFDPSPWCATTYADAACTTPIVVRRYCAPVPRAVVLGVDQGGGFCTAPSPVVLRPVQPTPSATASTT